MFIPIGHDQDTVRRLPWVTFGIMGICLALYLLTLPAVLSNEKEIRLKAEAIAEYYFQHPETQLPPELEEAFLGSIPEFQGQREAFKEFLKETTRAKEEQAPIEEQQARLDELVESFYETRDASPFFSLGLIPAHQTPLAYLTSMFMHGGFWHLLGNMFFLYLSGPYIEDVWGRPLFAAFYLSAGILSAFVFCMKYPDMNAPLVGASGAIAGVMGAFLIRHARVKIRFLFFFLMRPKVVSLPAWVMLPLWLAREILFGQATDYAGTQGGVAHWAHVAGFVYGAVVAVAIRKLDFETKFEGKLDAASTVHENTALEAAMEEMWHGDRAHGREMLIDYLRSSPGDIDAAGALWDISRDIGGLAVAAPFLMGAIRESLRKKDYSFVETRWPEVMDVAEPGWLDPGVAARVAEVLTSSAPPSLIERTIDAVADQVDPNTAPGLLVRLARSGHKAGASSAARFAALALENPELPEDTRREMIEIAGEFGTEKEAPVEERSETIEEAPPVSPPPIQHELEIIAASPVAWNSTGKLRVKVGNAERSLQLQQVQAIAVGGIKRADGPPYLVIDLMLDGPWSNRRKLRVIRMKSTDFDPTRLVEAPNAMEAFRTFIEELLRTSEATPLPGPDAARGRPFESFESLETFEETILG